MNFIFARLCDNDYSAALALAVPYVETHREAALTPEQFKHFVIRHVAFFQAIRRIHPLLMGYDTERTTKYLEESLTIEYLDQIPTVDHDGGSVIYDVSIDYAWTT